MKYKLKLRDLEAVLSPKIDMEYLMREVGGFKVPRFNKGKAFLKAYNEMVLFIDEISKKDFKEIYFDKEKHSLINLPQAIDGISLVSTLELQSLKGGGGDLDFVGYVSKYIATACFEANHEGEKFNSESDLFKSFTENILDADAF